MDRTVDLKHVLQAGKPLVDKVSNTKETEAGTEISVLVNYCQSVQFTSFENAESKYVPSISSKQYTRVSNNFCLKKLVTIKIINHCFPLKTARPRFERVS